MKNILKYCNNCCKYYNHYYHNTIIEFCTNCNIDKYGNKIYNCNMCGLYITENKMENKFICINCYNQNYNITTNNTNIKKNKL